MSWLHCRPEQSQSNRSWGKDRLNALLIEPLCAGPWGSQWGPISVLATQCLSILQCRLKTLNSVIALIGAICKANRMELPLKCPWGILCEVDLIKCSPLCFYLVLSINDPENVWMKNTGGKVIVSWWYAGRSAVSVSDLERKTFLASNHFRASSVAEEVHVRRTSFSSSPGACVQMRRACKWSKSLAIILLRTPDNGSQLFKGTWEKTLHCPLFTVKATDWPLFDSFQIIHFHINK